MTGPNPIFPDLNGKAGSYQLNGAEPNLGCGFGCQAGTPLTIFHSAIALRR
jgi:hypothetical protein